MIINYVLSRGWSRFHPREISHFRDDNFPSDFLGVFSFLVFIYVLFVEALYKAHIYVCSD
jgi:hypothetical protein